MTTGTPKANGKILTAYGHAAKEGRAAGTLQPDALREAVEVAQAEAAAGERDWQGDPGELEWLQSASPRSLKTWHLQERFLTAYGVDGTVQAGLQAAGGLTRRAFELWQQHDAHGFKARFQRANAKFCETLEAKAVELAMNQKTAGCGPRCCT